MPHQMFTILLDLNKIAKENKTGPIACHWCNNQDNIIKYGFYKRYEFFGKVKIRIQRLFCKSDKCRRTFSILPHPFLRFTSLSLCMFTVLLQLFDQGIPIAEICRRLGLSLHLTLEQYIAARDALIEKDLICFDGTLFQVLSLPSNPTQSSLRKSRRQLNGPQTPAAIGAIIGQSLKEMSNG